MNTKCWEHFLMDEPQSLRGVTLDAKQNEISRHLVMPNSWVKVLEVPRNSMHLTRKIKQFYFIVETHLICFRISHALSEW